MKIKQYLIELITTSTLLGEIVYKVGPKKRLVINYTTLKRHKQINAK